MDLTTTDPEQDDRLTFFLDQVAAEVRRAQAKYPRFNSLHEAESVLREEVIELTREIFVKQADRDWRALRTETVHVGAMVARLFVERLGSEDQARETALYRDSLVQQVADLQTENARLLDLLDSRARTTSDAATRTVPDTMDALIQKVAAYLPATVPATSLTVAEAVQIPGALEDLIQAAADQYLHYWRTMEAAPLEKYLIQHGITCGRCGTGWELVHSTDPTVRPFLRCSNPACQAVPQLPG